MAIKWRGFWYETEGDLYLHATEKEAEEYSEYLRREEAEKQFSKFMEVQYGVNSFDELENWCITHNKPYGASTIFSQFIDLCLGKRHWEDCVFN